MQYVFLDIKLIYAFCHMKCASKSGRSLAVSVLPQHQYTLVKVSFFLIALKKEIFIKIGCKKRHLSCRSQ